MAIFGSFELADDVVPAALLPVTAVGIHRIKRIRSADDSYDIRQIVRADPLRIAFAVISLMVIACTVVRLWQKRKSRENLLSPDRMCFHDRIFFIGQARCLFQNRIRDRDFPDVVQKRTPVNLIHFFLCRMKAFQIFRYQPRIIRNALGMLSRVVILFIDHPSDRCHGIDHQLLCIFNSCFHFCFHRFFFFFLSNPVFFEQQVRDKHQQKKGPVKYRVIEAVIPGIRVRHLFTRRSHRPQDRKYRFPGSFPCCC